MSRATSILLLVPLAVACARDDGDATPVDTDTDGADGAHLVVSDSFETPGLPSAGDFMSLIPDGWTTWTSGSGETDVGVLRPAPGVLDQVEPLAPPADGDQTLWLWAAGDGTNDVSTWVDRRVVDVAVADETYTTRIALARRADQPDDVDFVELSLGVHQALIADPSPAPFTTVTLTPTTDVPDGAWREVELAWTATSEEVGFPVSVRIAVGSSAANGGQRQLLVDHVRAWIGAPE